LHVFSPEEILDAVYGNHTRRSIAAFSGVLRRLRQKMANNDPPDPVENVPRGMPLGSRPRRLF
jgi:hypothetical protein